LPAAEGGQGPRPHDPVRARGVAAAHPPGQAAAHPPDRDAERAVAALYDTYGRPLTRLATLLAGDEAVAEEIVRDAFVAMHGLWRQLRDGDRALSYLQETVVRRSRSRLAAGPVPPGPGVVAALRALPVPQREALVLRYYAGLSDARIASVMHISARAVNHHIACGMSSLQATLGSH
jgi:DNA-directed RNA polymerase specialized sigma24 family protein